MEYNNFCDIMHNFTVTFEQFNVSFLNKNIYLEYNNFCDIMHNFTVTFEQFNVSFLNKSINFLQKQPFLIPYLLMIKIN